jgi:hypothetical protein
MMKPVRALSFLAVAAALAGAARPALAEGAAVASAAAPAPEPSPSPSPIPSPAPAAAVPAPLAALASDWKVGGDFRVRYEGTTRQKPGAGPSLVEPRHREVVRMRAGVTRQFGSVVTVGARLTTGAAEDPNSTDVTIGDFADELEVSLDRMYVEIKSGGLAADAGKFVNPFATTELVWDGDVHPQGVAASYVAGTGSVRPKVVGMLYLVDEQATSADSYMAGAQAQVSFRRSPAFGLTLAGGYYDYTIKSLRNADSGDTRSNRLATGGLAYASDFDLLNAVASVDHRGFGKRFPVRLVADYVRNLGADGHDDGFGVDLFVGRAVDRNDLRMRYGYAQTETDAVLGAFSHDNTTLATNYRQHTGSFDWQVRKELQLNATWYVFRKLEAAPGEANPWLNRLRVNALVSF